MFTLISLKTSCLQSSFKDILSSSEPLKRTTVQLKLRKKVSLTDFITRSSNSWRIMILIIAIEKDSLRGTFDKTN